MPENDGGGAPRNQPPRAEDDALQSVWYDPIDLVATLASGAGVLEGAGKKVLTAGEYLLSAEGRTVAKEAVVAAIKKAGTVFARKPAVVEEVCELALKKAPKRINSARVLKRMATLGDKFHDIPVALEAEVFKGTRTVVSESYVVYTKSGILNGVEGTFEIGVKPSISGNVEVITHRFFRPSK